MVFVLVFDRQMSVFSPVIMGFASDRLPSSFTSSSGSQKYAYEIDAKRGNLQRLYRHFLLGMFT